MMMRQFCIQDERKMNLRVTILIIYQFVSSLLLLPYFLIILDPHTESCLSSVASTSKTRIATTI